MSGRPDPGPDLAAVGGDRDEVVDAPRIVARVPGPGVSVPPGCGQLAIAFDRPMDTRRGRVRLVWGRIAAHTVNVAARHFRWDIRDAALAWSEDGRTLALAIPPGLCDGFRVRVEWGDLHGAACGLSPVPAEREAGASYVVVFGRAAGAGAACTGVAGSDAGAPDSDAGPRFTSLPPNGATDVRRDPTIELYADRPLAAWDPATIELTAAGERIGVRVRTNRNPPDWVFVTPERALPPDADVTLRFPPMPDTRGAVGPPHVLRFRTGSAPPASARAEPGWSEPTDGLDAHPRERLEAALRVPGQVPLAAAGDVRARLVEEGTERVVAATPAAATERGAARLGVEVDPTPGHAHAVVISSRAGFPRLAPAAWYRLEWDGLGAPGFAPPAPGALRFRAADGPPAPLVPLIGAVSLFAHPDGTRLQVAAHVFAEGPVEAWVEEPATGWRAPLTAHGSRDFTDALKGELRAAPPRLLSTLEAPILPPGSGNRTFRVEVHAGGHLRRFDVFGYDFGQDARLWGGHAGAPPNALAGAPPARTSGAPPTVLPGAPPAPTPGAGPVRFEWSAASPCDAQHLALLRPDGVPVWAGLYAGDVRAAVLPDAWTPPPGRYVAQLWRVRARPEDDVWDYAIVDAVVEV